MDIMHDDDTNGGKTLLLCTRMLPSPYHHPKTRPSNLPTSIPSNQDLIPPPPPPSHPLPNPPNGPLPPHLTNPLDSLLALSRGVPNTLDPLDDRQAHQRVHHELECPRRDVREARVETEGEAGVG